MMRTEIMSSIVRRRLPKQLVFLFCLCLLSSLLFSRAFFPISATTTTKSKSTMSNLPRPVVFCGPSGVGKGTLIEMLMARFPNDQFGFSVSHTTRKPRASMNEVDGKHYHFTSVDEIKKEIDAGKFVEYAEVHGNYYGTSIASVESVQKDGKICILDIDVQGVQKVKKSNLSPLYLFISPPSMAELETRLRGRGTETEESIQKRLGNAAKELAYGQEAGNFDRVFVNANLNETFEDMAKAFREWYPYLDEIATEDPPKNCTSCAIS